MQFSNNVALMSYYILFKHNLKFSYECKLGNFYCFVLLLETVSMCVLSGQLCCQQLGLLLTATITEDLREILIMCDG